MTKMALSNKFMCLTMIDPASSLVEINLAGSDRKTKSKVGRADRNASEAIGETKEAYFDKSSLMISNLVNKCWFSRYPRTIKRISFRHNSRPSATTVKL